MKKCPSSIRCWDLNSQPSDYESPPLTTRQGLLPSKKTLSFYLHSLFNWPSGPISSHILLSYHQATFIPPFKWKNKTSSWCCKTCFGGNQEFPKIKLNLICLLCCLNLHKNVRTVFCSWNGLVLLLFYLRRKSRFPKKFYNIKYRPL